MNFKLTKTELSKSAYYCAAGIDLQPLLRFSDMTKDFIYVTAGFLNKDEIINGVKRALKNIQTESDVLRLESYNDFDLFDIEHPSQPKLIKQRPSYLNNEQWNNYMHTFSELARKSQHFNIHFKLYRKIGANIERELNLYYIVGEALATYDALFVQQNIAPKFFISIQSGRIEFPNAFSNKMFAGHEVRPCVWLRGAWESNSEVYGAKGIFNKQISEFENWDASFGVKIEGTTNENEKIGNFVWAFGEKDKWNFEYGVSNLTKGNGIIVQKIYKKFNEKNEDYDTLIAPWTISSLLKDLLPSLGTRIFIPQLLMVELIELVKLLYLKITQDKAKGAPIKIAIIPMGFEDEWEYVEQFANSFKINDNNNQLYLDYYYSNPLDFNRS